MNRLQLLAAEVFGYSFANYADHLGVNIRYDRLMPETIATLERGEREKWSPDQLAAALDATPEEAADLLESLREARAVVDAADPAISFREGLRISLRRAVADGLGDDDSMEKLVTQICYRAADLAFLLEQRGESLSEYSEQLRREPDVEYADEE